MLAWVLLHLVLGGLGVVHLDKEDEDSVCARCRALAPQERRERDRPPARPERWWCTFSREEVFVDVGHDTELGEDSVEAVLELSQVYVDAPSRPS